jgi:hypothetical protein
MSVRPTFETPDFFTFFLKFPPRAAKRRAEAYVSRSTNKLLATLSHTVCGAHRPLSTRHREFRSFAILFCGKMSQFCEEHTEKW